LKNLGNTDSLHMDRGIKNNLNIKELWSFRQKVHDPTILSLKSFRTSFIFFLIKNLGILVNSYIKENVKLTGFGLGLYSLI